MAMGAAAADPTDRKDRQARTRLARTAVIGAARALFLERGYASTTVDSISELSDVPPATVYRLFSSKLGILRELLGVSIAGDDDAVPLPERPQVRALLGESEPGKQLAGFAGICRGIMSRTEPVYRILVSAAGSDPDAAALLAEQTRQRRQGQSGIARYLATAGTLRPEVSERDAAAIIHALMSPEVYRLLVGDGGWDGDRYERWLRDTLIDQLLPRSADLHQPAGS